MVRVNRNPAAANSSRYSCSVALSPPEIDQQIQIGQHGEGMIAMFATQQAFDDQQFGVVAHRLANIAQ